MTLTPKIDLPLRARVDFDASVEAFYQNLFRFGLRLTGTESDAADLTQETYCILLKNTEAIREPRKVKAWLFTTLYRLFLKRRRRAVRFPAASIDSVEDELPPVGATQAERLDESIVLAALQKLEEKYRSPLTLFYLNQLSYFEIATALNLPLGTVMSRLSRGKARLSDQLKTPSPLPDVTQRNAA